MPLPFDIYDLRITVVAIEGRSVCALVVGDYFELTNSSHVRIPAGKHFCLYAMAAVMPLLPAKQRLLAMTPANYTGLAADLAKRV